MGTPSIQQPTSPNRTGWCHEVKMTGKWEETWPPKKRVDLNQQEIWINWGDKQE
jgi:hypothetical protein